jgi:hypothetical protein
MSYARRAALLAEDLNEWVPFYRRMSTPDAYLFTDERRVARADDRWCAIEDLVVRLQEISIDIASIR